MEERLFKSYKFEHKRKFPVINGIQKLVYSQICFSNIFITEEFFTRS